MKNLIFLLLSLFCFAKGQNIDSTNLAKLTEELEAKNKKIEVLLQKAEKVEKKHETMFYRLKIYVSNLIDSNAEQTKNKIQNVNREGIKVENPTDPVTEIDEIDGVDSIRGSWLYRFFHKNNYKLKYYKLINDEKIYLN
jgi:seryl-tRNA synthetase